MDQVELLILIIECPEPAPVPNAYRDYGGNTTYSWTLYACYDGFIVVSGYLEIQCLSTGSYDKQTPVCILDCQEPRSMTSAIPVYSTTTWNSSVTYVCRNNYTMVDPVQEYIGICSSIYHSWTRNTYQCSGQANLIQPYFKTYMSTTHGNFYSSKAIDNNELVCAMTSPETTPYWKVDLENEFYDFHRVRIRLDAAAGSAYSIHIEGILSANDTSGQLCANISNPGVVSWIDIYCLKNTWGKYLLVTADLGLYATQFSLCEIQVFGSKRDINCEHPPVMYGAEAVYNSTTYLAEVVYRCVHGFTYIGGTKTSVCTEVSYWSDVNIQCYDGFKASSSGVFPLTTLPAPDNDISTCHILTPTHAAFMVTEDMEIHSVTIVGQSINWSAVHISFTKYDDIIFLTANKSCWSDETHESTSDVRTFHCAYRPLYYGVVLHIGVTTYVSICEIYIWGRQGSKALECLQSENGIEYKGTKNTTSSGKPCQQWWASSAEILAGLPDLDVTLTDNSCRNPSGLGNQPWCYLDPNYTTWEYCGSMFHCDKVCLVGGNGSYYRGTKETTLDGRTCLPWSTVMAAKQPIIEELIDGDSATNNYCRNPGRTQTGPWCYTNTGDVDNSQLCDIPSCPTSCAELEYHQNYTYNFDECYTSTKTVSLDMLFDEIESTCHTMNYIHIWCFNASIDWYCVNVNCDSLHIPTVLTTESTDSSTIEATITTTEVTTTYPGTDTNDLGAIATTQGAITTGQGVITTNSMEITTDQVAITTNAVVITTAPEAITIQQVAITTKSEVITTDQGAMTIDSMVITSNSWTITTDPGSITTGSVDITTDQGTKTTAVTTDQVLITTDQGAVTTDSGTVTSDPDDVTINQGALSTDQVMLTTDQAVVTTDSGTVTIELGAVTTDPVAIPILGVTNTPGTISASGSINGPWVITTDPNSGMEAFTVTGTAAGSSQSTNAKTPESGTTIHGAESTETGATTQRVETSELTTNTVTYITGYRSNSTEDNCACFCVGIRNVSEEDIEEFIEYTNDQLLIDKKTVSAVTRKYTSVQDERYWVVYVGGSTVALFLAPLLLIILPDIYRAFLFLKLKCHLP